MYAKASVQNYQMNFWTEPDVLSSPYEALLHEELKIPLYGKMRGCSHAELLA
jgi:hypothetical protein